MIPVIGGDTQPHRNLTNRAADLRRRVTANPLDPSHHKDILNFIDELLAREDQREGQILTAIDAALSQLKSDLTRSVDKLQ